MSNRGGRRRQYGDMAVDERKPGDQIRVPFVEIRNWEGGPFNDAVAFVERKSRAKLQNPKQAGSTITAQVTANDVRNLENLSGIRFSGQKLLLKIVYKAVNTSPETSQTIQILKQFLQQRHFPDIKLLDLTAVMQDQTLQANGFLETEVTAVKTFKALMKIAETSINGVQSVKLDSNGLANAELILCVAETFPKLLNLSLANNMLESVQPFMVLRNKLPQLRELVLAGNPVQQHPAFQHQVQELLNMFPSLLILDGVQLRDEPQKPVLQLPMPIKRTFFEDEGVASVTPHFLTNFFMLWDTNRSGLMQLYDAASTFSLCYDGNAAHLPSRPGHNSSYISASRNLKRNAGQQARHNKIHIGPEKIFAAFNAIPPSTHDLSRADKFFTDSWKVSDVRQFQDTAIIISVHGEFVEKTKNEPRGFDRCLVVLPGGPSSYIVASDMLTIRQAARLPQSTPETQTAINGNGVAGVNGVPAVPVPGINPGTQPNPAELVQEVMRQTMLTPTYAEMCLQQANLDLNQALQLFQQFRSQLPPEAFQHSSM